MSLRKLIELFLSSLLSLVRDEHDSGELNVNVLLAHNEYWIVMHTDRRMRDALNAVGRWAADERLSFDWRDANRLADAIEASTPGDKPCRNRRQKPR